MWSFVSKDGLVLMAAANGVVVCSGVDIVLLLFIELLLKASQRYSEEKYNIVVMSVTETMVLLLLLLLVFGDLPRNGTFNIRIKDGRREYSIEFYASTSVQLDYRC
jgi:hypothetical protein